MGTIIGLSESQYKKLLEKIKKLEEENKKLKEEVIKNGLSKIKK